MGVFSILGPRRHGFEVRGVREPVVVSVFGEKRWPSVRGSFVLACQVVYDSCVRYGMCDTVFSYRLWIYNLGNYFWIH